MRSARSASTMINFDCVWTKHWWRAGSNSHLRYVAQQKGGRDDEKLKRTHWPTQILHQECDTPTTRRESQESCESISRLCLPFGCRTGFGRHLQPLRRAPIFGHRSIVVVQRQYKSYPCTRWKQKSKSRVTMATDFCTPVGLDHRLHTSPPREASRGHKEWHRLQKGGHYDLGTKEGMAEGSYFLEEIVLVSRTWWGDLERLQSEAVALDNAVK